MVCPHGHATSGLSLVQATWIVPGRNITDCTLDKYHGFSLGQVSYIDPGVSWIVPGTSIIDCPWDKYDL